LATGSLLARRGATVLLFDRDETELTHAVALEQTAGRDLNHTVGDVTEPSDCQRAVDECIARWGRLDILVNSAGIGGRNAPTWDLTDSDWSTVIDVDLNGVFYMTRSAVRQMLPRGWGRIVNISSMAGKEGNANASHYSSAKAAVIGFTKSIGKELATSGILVNAIAPAVIDTDILRSQSPEHVQQLIAKIPMGRVGTRIEVARMIAFLVSEQMSFSTGAVFDLSGGRATY
jgi:3-oxoacyl-[acyl-carrier protein] reductase